MTIKIGTIQEMTGEGYEILVDTETRSYVLARFFNGHLIGTAEQQTPGTRREQTLLVSAA